MNTKNAREDRGPQRPARGGGSAALQRQYRRLRRSLQDTLRDARETGNEDLAAQVAKALGDLERSREQGVWG